MHYNQYNQPCNCKYQRSTQGFFNPSKYYTTKYEHEEAVRGYNPALRQRNAMALSPEDYDALLHGERYMYHATHDEDTAQSIMRDGLLPFNHPDNPRSSEWSDYLRPRPNHVYLANESKIEEIAQGQNKPHVLCIDMAMLDPALINADEDAFVDHMHPANDDPGNTDPRPMFNGATDRIYDEKHSNEILDEHQRAMVRAGRRHNVSAMDAWSDPAIRGEIAAELRAWMDSRGIANYHSYGDWAEHVGLGNNPEQTYHSLKNYGTIAYNGKIPPEAIKYYPPGENCPDCNVHSPGLEPSNTGIGVAGLCDNCGWSSRGACGECGEADLQGYDCHNCGAPAESITH